MPTTATSPLQFDLSEAEALACPACHGDLRLEAARLRCGGCGRSYPIIEGVPALIAGRETDGGGSSGQ